MFWFLVFFFWKLFDQLTNFLLKFVIQIYFYFSINNNIHQTFYCFQTVRKTLFYKHKDFSFSKSFDPIATLLWNVKSYLKILIGPKVHIFVNLFRKENLEIKRYSTSTNITSFRFNFFQELYHLTGEVLGKGAYASVRTCKDVWTDKEFAVKIIDKVPGHSR